jgi:hypothetical protein
VREFRHPQKPNAAIIIAIIVVITAAILKAVRRNSVSPRGIGPKKDLTAKPALNPSL